MLFAKCLFEERIHAMPERLLNLLYVIPGVIIALSFHEWGHAFAAYKMGDPTARNLGRLTLNPLAHIDPMGFLMMVIVGFGWAKPVPVNPNNYRNYKAGELVVSLAGVTMNLILAIIGTIAFSLLLKVTVSGTIEISGAWTTGMSILNSFIFLNLCLLVFNLLPVYPLDGFHVAEVLFSKVLGPKPFMFMKNYGQYILIGILLLGRFSSFSPIGYVAEWLHGGLLRIFYSLFGV